MGKTIFVAAGHSATDPGAISADGKYREADLALRLRDSVVALLQARQVPVKADGAPGENKPLRDSIAAAKLVDGPKVEFHLNAGPLSGNGVEALSRTQEKALAQRLATAVAVKSGLRLRGELGFKSQDSGQHHRLGFIADAHGVILEVCFISNPADLMRYLAAESAVAKAIADVLAEAAGATNPLPAA